MFLKSISLLNYKNITDLQYDFDAKINSFVGKNGVGKTNVLDAIYHLAYGKSYFNPLASQNIKHGEEFFVIGSLIKGETMHFEYVCEGVTQGIKDLNLMYDIPTIFCLLTDNNKQQSLDRSGGKHGNKGVEAAIAAIKMVTLG